MDTIEILVRGKLVLLDEDRYDIFSQFKWYITSNNYVRSDYRKRQYIYLHHLVMGQALPPWTIDHINRNGLDNRQINLRYASQRLNSLNHGRVVKGYYWREGRQKWVVRFNINGVLHYYGHYTDEIEAQKVAKNVRTRLIEEAILC